MTILAGTPSSLHASSSIIGAINESISHANPDTPVDFDLSTANSIHITPYTPTGNLYAQPEWAAIINKAGITLHLSGTGGKAVFMGDPRQSYRELTRAILNRPGALMSLENIQFSNCNYRRQGGTLPGGGAVSNWGGTANIAYCDFNDNSIYGYDRVACGGAISSVYVVNGQEDIPSNVDLSYCTFTGNYATVDPDYQHSAMGGALFQGGGKASVSFCVFKGNYVTLVASKTGNTSGGGAICNQGSIIIDNSAFIGNKAIGTNGGAVYGGALWTITDKADKNSVVIKNSHFEDNYVSSSVRAYGGAIVIHTDSIANIQDTSFINNYNASPIYGGGAIETRGQINLIAESKDVIFQGNTHHVTQIDENGKALDGLSNAIHTSNQGRLNLIAGNDKKIIFNDSLMAERANTPLHINPNTLQIQDGAPVIENPYSHDGEIVFGKNVVVDCFSISLFNGSMKWEDKTFIKGKVTAHTDTSLQIDGFTSIGNGIPINSLTGVPTENISEGGYYITGDQGVHTVLIKMTDAMVRATDIDPVWSFNDGAAIHADEGKLAFVLDISEIQNRPEKLNPFIFSHTQSTDETKASVAGAKSVLLIDSDGWSYEYETYTVNGITYDKFYFLSGQYGVTLPIPAPKDPAWVQPQSVGNAQIDTLWTTAHSLWSFADNARNASRHYLNPDRKVAFWITAMNDFFTQEDQTFCDGYRYRSYGYSAGGEITTDSGWTWGGALGQNYGDHDVNHMRGRIDKDAILALAYANRLFQCNQSNTIVLDIQAGYEYSENKGGVRMDSPFGDTLSGKWHDNAWMIDIKGIWAHHLYGKGPNRLFMDTYAGLQYTDARQSDTTIQGEKYAYTLNDGFMNVLRGNIGTGIRQEGIIGNHGYIAYIRTGIIQDLSRETPQTYVSGTDRAWTALGNKPGRTAFNAATGIQFQLAAGWSTGLAYNIETAKDSLIQSGRISVIYQF